MAGSFIRLLLGEGIVAKLYLIDIENICRKPKPSIKEIQIARKLILARTEGNAERDYFVIGCHSGGRHNLNKAWPKADKSGRKNMEGFSPTPGTSQKDGADRALSFWLEKNSNRLKEWEEVVIASGDHHFFQDAKNLVQKNKKVTILSRSNENLHAGWYSISKIRLNYLTDLSPVLYDNLGSFTEIQIDEFLSTGNIPAGSSALRANGKIPTKSEQKSRWSPKPGSAAKVRMHGKVFDVLVSRNKDSQAYVAGALVSLPVGHPSIRDIAIASVGDSLIIEIDAQRLTAILESPFEKRFAIKVNNRKVAKKQAKPKQSVRSKKTNGSPVPVFAPGIGAKALIDTQRGTITVKIWKPSRTWLSEDFIFTGADTELTKKIFHTKLGDPIKFKVDGVEFSGKLASHFQSSSSESLRKIFGR